MTAKQGAHEIIEIENEGRRESVAVCAPRASRSRGGLLASCSRRVRKLIGESCRKVGFVVMFQLSVALTHRAKDMLGVGLPPWCSGGDDNKI